jgi:hypothetical protein
MGRILPEVSIWRCPFVVRVEAAKSAVRSEEEAMKYLLTFIVGERRRDSASPEEMEEGIKAWSAFDREATDAGALIACEPVEDAETTIRVGADGERTVTDGPFAESKEQLGGFCLLECADLEEALDWANKVPIQPNAAIEVRPIMDLSQFGYESATVSPEKARATA